jgi:hypothetical protein
MVVSANAADKLEHVVCFKFKTAATAHEIKLVEEAFQALKQKIPQVVSLEWGTNVSKEKRDKGFTHCFVLTFKSEQDRDSYIEHPEHKAFGKIVGPVVDAVQSLPVGSTASLSKGGLWALRGFDPRTFKAGAAGIRVTNPASLRPPASCCYRSRTRHPGSCRRGQ